MKTWKVEAFVVFAILAAVAVVSHAGWRDWIGVFTVQFTFMHGQVSSRLSEKEAAGSTIPIECHRLADRYFLAKETLWVVYFSSKMQWAPLIGCFLFIGYVRWRRWWRARHPLPLANP